MALWSHATHLKKKKKSPYLENCLQLPSNTFNPIAISLKELFVLCSVEQNLSQTTKNKELTHFFFLFISLQCEWVFPLDFPGGMYVIIPDFVLLYYCITFVNVLILLCARQTKRPAVPRCDITVYAGRLPKNWLNLKVLEISGALFFFFFFNSPAEMNEIKTCVFFFF